MIPTGFGQQFNWFLKNLPMVWHGFDWFPKDLVRNLIVMISYWFGKFQIDFKKTWSGIQWFQKNSYWFGNVIQDYLISKEFAKEFNRFVKDLVRNLIDVYKISSRFGNVWLISHGFNTKFNWFLQDSVRNLIDSKMISYWLGRVLIDFWRIW